MEFHVDGGLPRGLPSKAAARFSSFGFGSTVDRRDMVHALGSRRAADQFIHTWARRGLLVPSGWGSYLIPEEPIFVMALGVRSPAHSKLVTWAATATKLQGVSRPLAYMAPVLWDRTRLSLQSPAPLLPLRPSDTTLRPQAPQLEAFAADLGWETEPLTIRVGDLGTVRARAVSARDVAWILRLNKDPRLREAGSSLIAALPRRDKDRAMDIRRLAAFPAWTPTHSRPLALPRGPPGQFRLFAPAWYMKPHQRALEAEDRRSADG